MARSRIVKPEFFKHVELFDAEQASGLPLRLAFEGLWCVADREGRFAWRPRELKLDVLPYDPVDFSEVLDALERFGFVRSYTVDGKRYGVVPSLTSHQSFHHREAPSKLPPPPDGDRGEPEASPVQAPVQPSSSRTASISASASTSASASDAGSVSDASPQPATKVLSLEAESYRRTYPRVADALLPDQHGDPLVDLCLRVSGAGMNPIAYVAEMDGALDGMHGAKVPPKYLRVAVVDWLANRAPPNMKLFRSYLANAMPKGGGVAPNGEPESAIQASKRKLLAGIPKEQQA